MMNVDSLRPVVVGRSLDRQRRFFQAYGLDQDQIWVDANGTPHLVELLRGDHRRNLVRFLERNAARFHNADVASAWRFAMSVNGDMASIDADRAVGELEEQEPLEWLRERPLYQRLVAMNRNEELAPEVDPW